MACLIPQTPLVRALFEDFATRRVAAMTDAWDLRQFELLVEMLVRAGHADSYLPDSTDRQLEPILHAIRLDPPGPPRCNNGPNACTAPNAHLRAASRPSWA